MCMCRSYKGNPASSKVCFFLNIRRIYGIGKTEKKMMRKIENRRRARRRRTRGRKGIGMGEAPCQFEVKHTAAVITFHCRGHTHTRTHTLTHTHTVIITLCGCLTWARWSSAFFFLWLCFRHVRSVFHTLKTETVSPIHSAKWLDLKTPV